MSLLCWFDSFLWEKTTTDVISEYHSYIVISTTPSNVTSFEAYFIGISWVLVLDPEWSDGWIFQSVFPLLCFYLFVSLIPHTESPAGHLSVGSWQNEQKWCDWQDLSGLWCYRKPAASLGGYAVQPTQTCGSVAHITLCWTGGHNAGLETHAKDPICKQKLLRNLY